MVAKWRLDACRIVARGQADSSVLDRRTYVEEPRTTAAEGRGALARRDDESDLPAHPGKTAPGHQSRRRVPDPAPSMGTVAGGKKPRGTAGRIRLKTAAPD